VILYFIFLFLVPFQEHPILGAQLFHVGPLLVTPIKLVGIPLIIAALLMPRPRDAASRPSSVVLLLFAAFALVQVVGTTLSSSSFPATDASTLLSFAILIFATSMLISNQNRLQMTVRTIVLVEAFASTWLYKQYYIYHWPRPIGPSSDPNYEALSWVMSEPLGIWLIRYDDSELWKFAGWICTPILAFAVFVSQSRGGLLALIVMAGLGWMKSRHKMRFLLGAAGIIVVLLSIAPAQAFQRFRDIRINGQLPTGAELSALYRIELGRAGLHMMEAHPVFGVGLNEFKDLEFHYNPTLAFLEPIPHIAHDTYVQLGAEGGVPTLALYLAILAATLLSCRNARKLPGVPENIAALAWAFQLGLIGYMVAACFLSAQYVKEPWVLISLTPNLYAIALHVAAGAKKTGPSSAAGVTPAVMVTPRLVA
jgi:putative inorganic carbon (HCO3(-)) transporter